MAIMTFINRVNIGFGAISDLRAECASLNIRRPLVVTDNGIRLAAILSKIENLLTGIDYLVFDKTPPNPTEDAVLEGARVFNDGRCDGLIALGGGSPLDCAKGIAIAATHDGPFSDYAFINGGTARISNRTPPIVAIPTTSGTGSEVGRGAVFILNDHRKLTFRSDYILPRVAICDPELTFGLPRALTAATGMDAIAHCIETFLSSAFNPPADAIALDGLRRGWSNIELAAEEGTNRDARLEMMLCAIEGALAFPKGVGCVHSISHSLGGVDHRLHHGTLNAVLLPAVLRFNSRASSVVRDRKMDRLAEVMGLPPDVTVSSAIANLNRRLGLPPGLSAMGFSVEHMEQAVEGALKDACHFTNPREASADDYREMLGESL